MNVINAAWRNGLAFLGSSCIYPHGARPMQESCLLTSEAEKTNEAYALAKISGPQIPNARFLNRQYGTDFISVNAHQPLRPQRQLPPEHSHVLPPRSAVSMRPKAAPVRHLSGRRQPPSASSFYVDDLANLCVFLMNNYSDGTTVAPAQASELTIKALTELVAATVGYEGESSGTPPAQRHPHQTPRRKQGHPSGSTYTTELPRRNPTRLRRLPQQPMSRTLTRDSSSQNITYNIRRLQPRCQIRLLQPLLYIHTH